MTAGTNVTPPVSFWSCNGRNNCNIGERASWFGKTRYLMRLRKEKFTLVNTDQSVIIWTGCILTRKETSHSSTNILTLCVERMKWRTIGALLPEHSREEEIDPKLQLNWNGRRVYIIKISKWCTEYDKRPLHHRHYCHQIHRNRYLRMIMPDLKKPTFFH